MIEHRSVTVQEGGVRLDAALVLSFPSTTRSFAREAVEAGSVTVNGKVVPKGSRLKAGDVIDVISLAEESDNRVAPDSSVRLNIVFEDDVIIALDKPALMPVQPLDRNERGTLMNGVVARYPECREVGDSPLIAGALHRIDAATSGLVLVARSAEAFSNVRAQFAAQSVKKTYLALVEGDVAVGGVLENDLAHDPTLEFCRMIDARHNRLTLAQREKLRPMHAVTRYEPIGRTMVENEERTLLEVTIFTGVTHQIRAQLAMARMHIVNDTLYGAFPVAGISGHCLHSLSAAFNHPSTGQKAEIRTPYPEWAKL